VGCGRNIDRDGGLGLSDDEIDYLLQNDIKRCRDELNNEYTWFKRLDAVRQDAIIDLFFNLGATRFRQFKKAIGYLESDDYIMSAAEFLDSRWSQQVGYRAEEICEMIETGEYASA